ncbi:hypothetical protein CK910_14150 [Aeromonas sp. CA23]|nr:hypothetical protein CK910_14150 [Aeromonas sp. CA23]
MIKRGARLPVLFGDCRAMAVVWLMCIPAGRLLDRVYDEPAGYLFASEGGVIHGEQATLLQAN